MKEITQAIQLAHIETNNIQVSDLYKQRKTLICTLYNEILTTHKHSMHCEIHNSSSYRNLKTIETKKSIII